MRSRTFKAVAAIGVIIALHVTAFNGAGAASAATTTGADGTASDAPSLVAVQPTPVAESTATPTPTATESPAPTATEAPAPTPTADSADAATTGDHQGSVNVDFHPYRVSLVNGKNITAPGKGTIDGTLSDITADKLGAFQAKGDYYMDVVVRYQIAMLGKADPNWAIDVHINQNAKYYLTSSCNVVYIPTNNEGRPNDTPYTCQGLGQATKSHVGVNVGLNDDGESSGSITTTGNLTLQDGAYGQPLPYSIPGAKTVEKNSTTTFSTVLREGDHPSDQAQARTQFQYRIVDNGELTSYFLAGWSTNFRGATKFSGDGHCDIYYVDPSKATEVLEKLPTAVSPYDCQGVGGYVSDEHSDGHNHWNSTFTLVRRDTVVITDPGQQTRIVLQNCPVAADRCGMSLSQVDKLTTNQDPVAVTGTSTGPGEVTIETDHTQTTTFSFAEEISTEADFGIPFVGQVTATLSTTFGYDTQKSTTAKTGHSWPLIAGQTAYVEGYPHVIVAKGLVVVRDSQGTYFEMPGADVRMPSADGLWDYKVVTVSGGVGGAEPGGAQPAPGNGQPALIGGQPASGAGQNVTAKSGTTGSLASTGAVWSDVPLIGAGLLLALGALGFTFARLRRRARTRN